MWDMREFDIAGRMREGERIRHEEDLIAKERRDVQEAKDNTYNRQNLSRTDTEVIFRISSNVHNYRNDPIWWYLKKNKLHKYGEFSAIESFCYDVYFLVKIGAWERYKSFPEMFKVCLSFIEQPGYVPMVFRYHEDCYSNGNHIDWFLHYFECRMSGVGIWSSVCHGLREFIRYDLGYTPDKYSNRQEFTLWFKIIEIPATKY